MSPSKNEPGSDSSNPKIAIKGFSLSSKSGNSKPSAKPQFPTHLGKRSRSSFAHDADDNSDDDTDIRRGKHEAVTGFGADGAIKRDDKKIEGPLVIPRMENKDWKGEARARRGGKNLLPPEVQAARERAQKEKLGAGEGKGTKEGVDIVNGSENEIQWGLSVRKRIKPEDQDASAIQQATTIDETPVEEEKHSLSADEEALQALLGTKTEKKGPDMIIAAASPPASPPPQISEADAYRRAIASAPDVSTLEDYERVPVEEFGAALLRGMGWKGEKVGGAKEIKRRQNLLGLGATELKGAEELGAWVQKSDVKRLNSGPPKSGFGDRRPKVSEYKREKERRDDRREERGGGSYRREKDRDRDRYRDDRRDRDRDRDYRR